jgi:hypothetical protein
MGKPRDERNRAVYPSTPRHFHEASERLAGSQWLRTMSASVERFFMPMRGARRQHPDEPQVVGLTPELSCKGINKSARAASTINSPFVSFSVR